VGVDPDDAMLRALELAERGRGTVSPNPLVGCVLVREGRIVAEGWHERTGGPHAEVVALEAAGERATGATAYVTLEPCAHTGRTGPCTSALLDAGVAAVEVALADPNPIAAGGAAALRSAGVPVRVGRHAARARRQNQVFLHVLAHGRPYVLLKAATSLDGRIAAADGTSQWLTGPPARRQVHELRRDVDAVAVGSGTILADDARLTVRLPDPGEADAPAPAVRRPPLRVVFDARGRTPAHARVLDASAPTLVLTTAEGHRRLPTGTDTVVLPPGPDGGVDLVAALATLLARDVHHLLVEGGATLASAFLAAGVVDRLDLHLAPLLLGDRGRPLFTGGPATLAEAMRLEVTDLAQVGEDVVISLTGGAGPLPDDPAIPTPPDAAAADPLH
jgi:diaminohydroxyphosphoribosylaminopyrimidine deaminase / 5-amino-6-(5-phosphoribosylamino)uracil reductase